MPRPPWSIPIVTTPKFASTKTKKPDWISIHTHPTPKRHAVIHSTIVVPKRPNIRCHRSPFPASAFLAFSSSTLIPYCLIQHMKGLFFAFRSSLISSFSLFVAFSSICCRMFGLISLRTGGLGAAAVKSSSLSSASGWPIGLQRGDERRELMVSMVEGGMSSSGERVADLFSSRSPHSLKSCSLRVWSSLSFFRRLQKLVEGTKSNRSMEAYLSAWSSAAILRRPWADILSSNNHMRSLSASSTWRANLHSHGSVFAIVSSSSSSSSPL